MRLLQTSVITIGIVIVLAACTSADGLKDGAGDGSESPLASRPAFGTMPPLTTASGDSGTRRDVPGAAWDAIVADLDARTDGGIDPDDIEVISVQEMTWNNGALGCPKPGEVYTQALVDGLRVIVSVSGAEYDYRVAGTAARLCH